MRIGVFDSGLGGLSVAEAIIRALPQYDYLYLGDTKRVPYGTRSQETIHQFTSEALTHLFANDCELIIIACNTASAESLRKSQQEYLPAHYPDRRILGVVIPTAEAVFEQANASSVAVLATSSTVESDAYGRELRKQCPKVKVLQKAAPLLVPLIENDGVKYVEPILDDYLAAFQEPYDALVLGCTHYGLIKEIVRAKVNVPVITQDEIVPAKVADYLHRHPEIESRLGHTGERIYHVTDITSSYASFAQRVAGRPLNLQIVQL